MAQGEDMTVIYNRRYAPIKQYDKAVMRGLILQPGKRTPSMAIFRAMLYNMSMPEEIIRGRKFMFRVISVAVSVAAVERLAAHSFTGCPKL